MSVFLIAAIISILIYVVVGLYVGKFVKSSDDYYVMARSGSTLLMTGHFFATFLSIATFIAYAGLGYANGWTSSNAGWGAIAIIWIMALMGIRISRFGKTRVNVSGVETSRGYTISDFMGDRYNSELVRGLTTFSIFMGLMFYLSMQIVGVSIILDALSSLTFSQSVFIVGFTFLAYSAIGGALSVVVTDTIMFFVMLISGFVLWLVVMMNAGGPVAMVSAIDSLGEKIWQVGGGFLPVQITIIGLWLAWAPGSAAGPHMTGRAFLAKNETVWLRVMGLTSLLIIPWIYLYQKSFAYLRSEAPGIEQDVVFNYMVLNHVPVWVGAIMVVGLLAGAMSTTSTMILNLGSTVSRDLIQRYFKKQWKPKQFLMISRLSTFTIGLLAIFLAFLRLDIVLYLSLLSVGFFSAYFLPLFGGLYWRRSSKQAAIASIVSYLVVYLGLYLFVGSGAFNLGPAGVAFLTGLVVYFVTCFVTKPSEEEMLVFNSLLPTRSGIRKTGYQVKPRTIALIAGGALTLQIIFMLVGSLY